MPRAVLVTGSEGFLGRAICRALAAAGYGVVRLDRRLGQDVLDATQLRSLARDAWAAVHLASPCSAQAFAEQPIVAWQETVLGLRNVLDACTGRIVVPSTGTVYGESRLPAKEDQPLPRPANAYAAAKLECERLCLLRNLTGGDARILRIFTGYGPDERDKGRYASPLMHFIRAAMAAESPILFGDGTQVRDFVFVDDIADCVLRSLESPSSPPILNVGSGVGESFLGVVNLILERTGRSLAPRFAKPPDGYVSSVVADISLARQELGYSPRTSLAQGVEAMIAAYSDVAGRAPGAVAGPVSSGEGVHR